MINYPIPKSTATSIKRGMTGWAVYALQRACNVGFGIRLEEDGVFGPGTEDGVKKVQAAVGIAAAGRDGIAGPVTQAKVALDLASREQAQDAGLPHGLLHSQIEGESGNYLAAVSWATPGGVDCGIVQRRVYDYQYDDIAAVRRAFDAVYQIDLLAKSLVNLHSIFLARPGCKGSSEMAWRLAVLNHNYPTAADKISRYGVASLGSYWHSPQSWVVNIGAKFPDGTSVRTPYEWCQKYSLGAPAHREPGLMVKYVGTWT